MHVILRENYLKQEQLNGSFCLFSLAVGKYTITMLINLAWQESLKEKEYACILVDSYYLDSYLHQFHNSDGHLQENMLRLLVFAVK
jgi:hypothetical protein